MLSTALLAKYNANKKVDDTNINPQVDQIFGPISNIVGQTFAKMFLILLIFDLILITIAIIFTIRLKLPIQYSLLLIILFFIPGIGLIFQLFVIFYYFIFRH